MEAEAAAKLERFLQWLKVNGVELRDCSIRASSSSKGFGLFSSIECTDQRVLLVVPLDLAITPMRVLQDPLLGPKCQAMFEEGDVDDRLLMMLFLVVQRARKNSLWKPYLDLLPTTFGNPLWFTENELSELKGTALHQATELQKKRLQALFDEQVKDLVTELLNIDGKIERVLSFEDFLWANSIFWTRALNIPFPRSYVFPEVPGEHGNCIQSFVEAKNEAATKSTATQEDTIWVEGLVPGIDFCNHDIKAAATWEVDGKGLVTGVPSSMYLLSAEHCNLKADEEISISYGNKGNEELLYLYGFAINNNPDDYLMVHYPMEALQKVPSADFKAQLLDIQKAEMRCLLPKSLLDHGFFSTSSEQNEGKCSGAQLCNYSWSGQRKVPSYLNKLVFPDNFLTALRTIAMNDQELFQVSSLLEDLVESREDKQPSSTEARAAVWEVCGDAGALQLLVDLLSMKMVELEEGSGTEASDAELLENAVVTDDPECPCENMDCSEKTMSRKRWSSIVYRWGQKQLTNFFRKEAEHALQLSLGEDL